jgi:hypothetical protein
LLKNPGFIIGSREELLDCALRVPNRIGKIIWRAGKMIVYKVFYRNCELKKGDLIGMLIERRKDMRGVKNVESGLRWAKLTFGRMVNDKKEIFVVPYELELGSETKWLVEKGVFTKEEFWEFIKVMGKKVNRKKEGKDTLFDEKTSTISTSDCKA